MDVKKGINKPNGCIHQGDKQMPIPRRNKEVIRLKDINCPYCKAINTITRTTEEVLEYALDDEEDLWTMHVIYECSACGQRDHHNSHWVSKN